jgi:uncharacterized membrane protein YgdD (TMEM256/DUF423 family)
MLLGANGVRLAALLGFLGVLLGAFGAHGLRGSVPDALLDAYRTGVHYHLMHAVVMLALALYSASTRRSTRLPRLLFGVGILLFSGSLYAMAVGAPTSLGMITPIGGLLLLSGWLSLAFGTACSAPAQAGNPPAN